MKHTEDVDGGAGRLLRVADVADLLGLSRSQVYALLANGSLPCVRIGSSVRVPLDTLKQWIDTRTTGVSTKATCEVPKE